jgi:hypothetical protein
LAESYDSSWDYFGLLLNAHFDKGELLDGPVIDSLRNAAERRALVALLLMYQTDLFLSLIQYLLLF